MSQEQKIILVVDDEQDLRMIITRLLKLRSHKVIEAESGTKALEILRSGEKIDLLFLDVMMPEMDGYQLLAKMHEEGMNKDRHTVMLTALNGYPNIMKGYNVGADYYITKPFKNDTLLNIVDYLIGDLTPEEKQNLELLL
jgi:CheY-like chemotaxis protein